MYNILIQFKPYFWIKLNFYFNVNALYMAVDNENVEIVKLLCSKYDLDINYINVFCA